MTPKVWPILTRAIEEGIAYGYQRAYKHTDNPTEEQVKDAIFGGVIDAITDVFEVPLTEEQRLAEVNRILEPMGLRRGRYPDG